MGKETRLEAIGIIKFQHTQLGDAQMIYKNLNHWHAPFCELVIQRHHDIIAIDVYTEY